MKCPECSFENEEGAPYCENCGEVFPAPINIPAVKTPSTDASVRGEVLSDIPTVLQVPDVERAAKRARSADEDTPAKAAAEMFSLPDMPAMPDFSGLERLVDSSYVPPETVQAGDTAEIPRVEGGYVPRARSYAMDMTEKELRRRDREQKKFAKKLAHEQEKEERRRAKEAAAADVVVAAAAEDGENVEAEPGVTMPLGERPSAVTVSLTPEGDDDTLIIAEAEVVEPASKATASSKTAESAQTSRAGATTATFAPKADRAASTPKPPRGARRAIPKAPVIVVACLLLVLAAAGVAWGTYQAEVWGGKTIPEVVGLSQEAAVAALEESGFTVEVSDEKSDLAAGTVLAAAPDQGTRASEGTTVNLTVATSRTVPTVTGLTQQEALDALAAEGLSNVEVVEEKSNEADGTVLSVSPETGTPLLSTDAVTITVAVPYTVPTVEGLGVDAAKEALAAEGYEVTTRWSYTEDFEEGTALSTEPEAGTHLDTGSEVVLYVAKSRGNELVALARDILPGARLKNDTGRFIIDSVESVSYAGNDVVSYTCEAHQYEDVELPFGKGTTRVEDDKHVTLEGTLTFNSDNEVTSADPSISY